MSTPQNLGLMVPYPQGARRLDTTPSAPTADAYYRVVCAFREPLRGATGVFRGTRPLQHFSDALHCLRHLYVLDVIRAALSVRPDGRAAALAFCRELADVLGFRLVPKECRAGHPLTRLYAFMERAGDLVSAGIGAELPDSDGGVVVTPAEALRARDLARQAEVALYPVIASYDDIARSA